VHHELIESANGHDTFLIDFHLIDELVRSFLEESPSRRVVESSREPGPSLDDSKA
jgi:hypothetical protein